MKGQRVLTLNTQKAIAKFLDHEISYIDRLIIKKQELVDPALERFEACQQKAVREGLGRSGALRETGNEFVPGIPDGWRLLRLKYLFRMLSGYAFKSDFFRKEESEAPTLITPGSFDPLGGIYKPREADVRYVGEVDSRFCLERGDLVVAMTDLSYKKLILGRCEFVPDGDFLLNQRIAKIEHLREGVLPDFLRYAMNARSSREQVKVTATGATVFHSSTEKIRDTWIALPPWQEQKNISAYLAAEEKKARSLIQTIRDSIEHLREFRSALITAAVTGQIDVATWDKKGQTDRRLDEIEEAMQA